MTQTAMGFPDCIDNCPDVPNPGQEDANENGVGDACEGVETPPGEISLFSDTIWILPLAILSGALVVLRRRRN